MDNGQIYALQYCTSVQIMFQQKKSCMNYLLLQKLVLFELVYLNPKTSQALHVQVNIHHKKCPTYLSSTLLCLYICFFMCRYIISKFCES